MVDKFTGNKMSGWQYNKSGGKLEREMEKENGLTSTKNILARGAELLAFGMSPHTHGMHIYKR